MDRLVSVVVPVYNTGRFLKDCLESIVLQTYHNIEILVINDGSTDDSAEIIEQYAKVDSRIRVISNTNHGVSYSRNCGINLAMGDFITFVDSDDIINRYYVEKMVKAISLDDVSFVVCRYKSFQEGKGSPNGISFGSNKIGILKNDFYELSLLNGLLYSPGEKLYRLNLIKKYNIQFDEKLSNGEDQLFNFAYYSLITKYCLINEELYFYRTRKHSLSKSKTKKSLNDLYIARNALINFLSKNNVLYAKKIIAAHCMTDLIDYTSVENDGYKGYKKRVNRVKPYLLAGMVNDDKKSKILRFLLHYSIIFPVYIFYKLKY